MKVLVAIECSPASERVLDEAAVRPWPEGTTFSVVNVVDVHRFARLPALIEDAKREADGLVKAGSEKLLRTRHKSLSEVIMGFPRRAISEHAKEWHADLVMVGSHGHSAIGRFLLGSVAQGILRTAPCSVEIVRSASDEPAPSSHPMKILLATDGSDCSVGAALSVAFRPWPKGTVFKVLSVEELIIVDGQIAGFPLSPVYPQSLLEELTTQARDRANSAVGTASQILQGAGMKVLDNHAIQLGEPRAVILDTAKTWGADLIVLGSHGRRGMDRFLMGSVSEAVAIHAHWSVEVIRK
ncbi:MAG TPA: universal stress protein [Candidatus Acidoferrum sp.]|nr:universal stress protein [Candidatus Acidoferrum sp.]